MTTNQKLELSDSVLEGEEETQREASHSSCHVSKSTTPRDNLGWDTVNKNKVNKKRTKNKNGNKNTETRNPKTRTGTGRAGHHNQ